MPLRGKILNTWEADTGEVLQSQEVHNISIAIGVDPPPPICRVCVITRLHSGDADSDGSISQRSCAPCFCVTTGRW